MHQGLDLSKFKKISSDKKSSTLRHARGHEIKIAHSGMSPKMREQIEGLPIYMAEGGDVEVPDDDEDDDDDAPEEVAPETPEEPEAPEEEAPPEPVAPEEEKPAPPPRPAGQREVPASNTFNVVAPKRPPPTPQDLDNEDALTAQDFQRGHLKPETYADLFGKKDTLGKIGTIFGLLVGGFGSGLTGQPNALLEMMNKEIANDFEAQKLSNTNAQNWLRLSQQHELQKAQLGQMGLQNKKTEAETARIPFENEQTKAATESARQDALYKGSETALNKMRIAAFQKLNGEVERMPPGPSKDAAVSALQSVGSAIQAENAKTNANVSGLLTTRAAVRGDLPEPAAPAIDQDKLKTLAGAGAAAVSLGVPVDPRKAMTPQQVAEATREAGKVQLNRVTQKSWADSFEHLDKRALAGILNPQDRNAAVELLSAQISKQTGASAEVAKKQAEALFPSPKDWGSSRDEKIKKGMEHFQLQEADTPTLDLYALKTPMQAPPMTKKKEAMASRETKKTMPKSDSTPTKTINGATYRKVQGGWQKVK